MTYYKTQYNTDQFAHKDNWNDLYSHPTVSLEEAYKKLLHFTLKTNFNSYLRCRIVKIAEEQVYFDERLEKDTDSHIVYVD